MNSNTVGILIIIGIIVLGIISGGQIFQDSRIDPTDGSGRPAETPSWLDAPNLFPDTNFFETGLPKGTKQNLGNSSGGSGSGTGSTGSGSGSTSAGGTGTGSGQTNIPQGPSPYKDKIKITSVNYPGELGREYFAINSTLRPTETVNISGWYLKSIVTGKTLPFDGGAEIPTVGQKSSGPINLTGNMYVFVYPGRSPINTSFRLNKCSGYLEDRYNFVPSVPTYQCPRLSENAPGLSRDFNDVCLDYIDRIPRCKIQDEDDYPAKLSQRCEDFIEENASYAGCVDNHRNDADFLKNEWRIYTNQAGQFSWESRDTIQLFDNFGRLVSEKSYK